MILPFLIVIFIILLVVICWGESGNENKAIYFVIAITAFAAFITFLPPLPKVLRNEKGIHFYKHMSIYILIIVIVLVYIFLSWYDVYKEKKLSTVNVNRNLFLPK